jgi:hypothetical protein
MMINPMQIIVYLPLFNVPFPALPLQVFSVIVPIIRFDILDEIDWQGYIFGNGKDQDIIIG